MKKRSTRRLEAEPTREEFIATVANLLEAANEMVTGGVSIGPQMERFSPVRANALRDHFIELAYRYASLVQQLFDVSREDLERGAAAMLDRLPEGTHAPAAN